MRLNWLICAEIHIPSRGIRCEVYEDTRKVSLILMCKAAAPLTIDSYLMGMDYE